MATLTSCLCCSILTGCIIGGVYVSIAYFCAFIILIWWIFEAESGTGQGADSGLMPLPGYLLCVGYLILSLMSILMLHGLYKRNERALMIWLFIMVLFAFPELGMVLFMCFYHWNVSSSYGTTDLILYTFRLAFNILCIVCVHSQYSIWKDELINAETLKRLEHLHLNTMTKGKQNRDNKMAYNNPAFISNDEAIMVNSNGQNLQRSYSSASQFSAYRNTPVVTPIRMPPPYYMSNRTADSQSEFNAALFSPGILPLGMPNRSEVMIHSNGHVAAYPYPNELSYVTGIHPEFSTQSLDRRRYLRRGVGYSSSVEALNLRLGPAIVHHSGVVGYLRPAMESRSSLGAGSDDFRRYRDVAL